jgi:hypothetical protein
MKNQLIKIIKTLFIIIIPLVITSCIVNPHEVDEVENTRYSAAEPINFKLGSVEYSQLKVQAINGIIEIIGIPQLDSIIIRGEKRVESESITDAEEHLDDILISLESTNEYLLVKTNQPSHSSGRNYLVHYIIEVPDTISVDAQLINGQILVSDIKNSVQASNTNGEIELESIYGGVISSITNGRVVLSDVHGNAIASVVNGSIEAGLILPDSGRCNLSTVNGDVTLTIPQNTSAIFRATTVNGQISISHLLLTNSTFSQTLVSGTLGNGEGLINLEAVNGNISASGF